MRLCQNNNFTKWAESYKEDFGNNQITYQYSLQKYGNFKVLKFKIVAINFNVFKFKMAAIFHIWSYVKTIVLLNEQNHIINNLVKTKPQYQFSLQSYVNFKVFKFQILKWLPFFHFWSCVKTVILINEQNYIINNFVKTKPQYQFSLQRYVNFKVFKFQVLKWPPFLHFWSYVKTVDT